MVEEVSVEGLGQSISGTRCLVWLQGDTGRREEGGRRREGEKGKGRREKGEGKREKGEGRKEKGEGGRGKGEGRREKCGSVEVLSSIPESRSVLATNMLPTLLFHKSVLFLTATEKSSSAAK